MRLVAQQEQSSLTAWLAGAVRLAELAGFGR
jgi:hypothetical protein